MFCHLKKIGIYPEVFGLRLFRDGDRYGTDEYVGYGNVILDVERHEDGGLVGRREGFVLRADVKMSKDIVRAIDAALWELGVRWQRGEQRRNGKLVAAMYRVRDPSGLGGSHG